MKDESLKNELHRLQAINKIRFLDVRSPDDPPLDDIKANQIANSIAEAFHKE